MRQLNAEEIRILLEGSERQRVSIDNHDILTIEVCVEGQEWLAIVQIAIVDRAINN